MFKDFTEETVVFRKECLNKDIKYSKIHRIYKDYQKDYPEDLKLVKKTLLTHYEKINNIFQFYAGSSSYPTMSLEQITEFGN